MEKWLAMRKDKIKKEMIQVISENCWKVKCKERNIWKCPLQSQPVLEATHLEVSKTWCTDLDIILQIFCDLCNFCIFIWIFQAYICSLIHSQQYTYTFLQIMVLLTFTKQLMPNIKCKRLCFVKAKLFLCIASSHEVKYEAWSSKRYYNQHYMEMSRIYNQERVYRTHWIEMIRP
jgi:hypothetical protein